MKRNSLLILIYFIAVILLASCQHSISHGQTNTNDTNFHAKRLSRTATILVNGTIEKVFPLFEPTPEKKWAEGWIFSPVYNETGSDEVYMIFETNHHGGKATWIISKLVPDSLIEYTVFNTDRLILINIQCKPVANKTEAIITYTLTSLSQKGNETIEKFLNHMYAENMKDWEDAINYYLANGKMITHN